MLGRETKKKVADIEQSINFNLLAEMSNTKVADIRKVFADYADDVHKHWLALDSELAIMEGREMLHSAFAKGDKAGIAKGKEMMAVGQSMMKASGLKRWSRYTFRSFIEGVADQKRMYRAEEVAEFIRQGKA